MNKLMVLGLFGIFVLSGFGVMLMGLDEDTQALFGRFLTNETDIFSKLSKVYFTLSKLAS